MSQAAAKNGHNHVFWLSGIGGFVLGALTVMIVLALAKRTGNRDEPHIQAQPTPQAVQNDQPQNKTPAPDASSPSAATSDATPSDAPTSDAPRGDASSSDAPGSDAQPAKDELK